MDYETYQSPFTWRYGSQALRQIWSETYKRRLWRRLWVVLAEAQAEFGLVTPIQLADLKQHQDQVDILRSLDIEAEIHHDLMAELKAFAEQSPAGGGVLHLGATSTDIEDNADVLRLRQSLDLILGKLRELLLVFSEKIQEWADLPLMAFTHLQPAEPSTLGYRLAIYGQDLMMDWEALSQVRANLRGKGFRGAVGTGAAYADLLGQENLPLFEASLSQKLSLPFFSVTSQVYPRKQDYQVISALAGLGGSLYKLAFDLRLLQSPPIGELSEPFGKKQVGSSAMPFKRNPINAEKIDSLGRALAQFPRLAWDNAAHCLLERTLDDSANRRSMLPEAFLMSDEMLGVTHRIMAGLAVNQAAIRRNLEIYAPFAAVERVLMALAKAGAHRQVMHERLRQHTLQAWEAIQNAQANPLLELLFQDEEILRLVPKADLARLMEVSNHLGDAPERARSLALEIQSRLS